MLLMACFVFAMRTSASYFNGAFVGLCCDNEMVNWVHGRLDEFASK